MPSKASSGSTGGSTRVAKKKKSVAAQQVSGPAKTKAKVASNGPSKASSRSSSKVAAKTSSKASSTVAAKKNPMKAKPTKAPGKGDKVVLLSGGNPQIAKGDGDAPVQAYISALTDWKRDVTQRLDALIVRTVPNVRKAVRWNSPFYAVEGRGYIVSFHVFTKYLKVTFFNGISLRPVPPGGTEKSKDVRWIDLHEEDGLDEAQMAKWVKQASAIPGWIQ